MRKLATFLRLGAAACVAAMLLAGAGRASRAETMEWLTGPALEQKLALPVHVQWSGMPVREALASLAKSQQFAILLDRRIDPSRPLEFKLAGKSLRETCEALAKELGGEFALVGPVGYIGPASTASKLRTLAVLRRAEAEKLPSAARAKLLKPQPFAWDDLATPRELLERLAAEAGMSVTGLDQVPHDLWAGAELPPTSLVERLTLIAGEWNLTFAFDPAGKTIQLLPLPEQVVLERSYPGGRNPAELAQRWQADAPHSSVTVVDGQLLVRGPVEDHERLAERSQPPKPAKKTPLTDGGQKVYTLSLTNVPRSQVLRSLGSQLKLDVKLDRDALVKAGVNPDGAISVDVRDATFEELMREILGPRLTYLHQGSTLEIMVKK